MSKRSNTVNDESSHKRFKNNEDLWGDDLDFKDIDDIFILATQVSQQGDLSCTKRNNVSILPPYNAFKNNCEGITSTQSSNNLNFPSTSKRQYQDNILQDENSMKSCFNNPAAFQLNSKDLQNEQVIEKRETACLQNHEKEIKLNAEHRYVEKQKEWTEKINVMESELGFKNFEVIVLKQQVAEMAKAKHSVTNGINTEKCTKSADVLNTRSNYRELTFQKECKFQFAKQTEYPLLKAFPSVVYSLLKKEKFILNFKSNCFYRNAIPYLQNQNNQKAIEKFIDLQFRSTAMVKEKTVLIDDVYSELFRLSKCNKEEINSEDMWYCVIKILTISEQLLENFCKLLNALQNNTFLENFYKPVILLDNYISPDVHSSAYKNGHWCTREISNNIRQTMTYVTCILPYSAYLQYYLFKNKAIGSENFNNKLPFSVHCKESKYTNLILKALNTIKNLKKSNEFVEILLAVTVFWNKAFFMTSKCDKLMKHIIEELIFCEKNIYVLFDITKCLKTAFLYKIFVKEFCIISKQNETEIFGEINNMTGTPIYEKECPLKCLCTLLNNSIFSSNSTKMLWFYLNIIKIASNALKWSSPGFIKRKNTRCDCLEELVQLFLQVLYELVEILKKQNTLCKGETQLWQQAIVVGLEILNVLNFKSSHLLVKYIQANSQCTEIINSLSRRGLKVSEACVELVPTLCELGTIEEIPLIESTAFNNILLW